MVSTDAAFLTNIYVPQLVEPMDSKRRGGQQQKDFMKDLAAHSYLEREVGPTAGRARRLDKKCARTWSSKGLP